MYSRIFNIPLNKSVFIFGPRATGKSTWIKNNLKTAVYIDLLDSENYTTLLANPKQIETYIGKNNLVVIDEIQKIPNLLNEVHRLIEDKKIVFVLTGSSARKLRKKGVNLLAGRALTKKLYPLTVEELADDFKLTEALKYGMLPAITSEEDKKAYLKSYIKTYLQEEVLQEGLTRNLPAFSRFLETASFSHGEVLNITEVAREAQLGRKLVENYFSILEDLLIAYRIPVFQKRAKRKTIAHPKFYFFDVGVYRAIRPKGPFDSTEEIEGVALETLFLQELKAINEYYNLGYQIYYWRTQTGHEVDFVLYGERGLKAFEIKRTRTFNNSHLKNLKYFKSDYEIADCYLLYGGNTKHYYNDIKIVPYIELIKKIKDIL